MATEFAALDRFEYGLGQAEKRVLNVAGIIPVVTGTLRCIMGQIQMIAGAVLGCFFALASVFSRTQNDKARFQEMAKRSFDHVFHGAANTLRGFVEYFPFGGLLLFTLYDHALHQRMKYAGEVRIEQPQPHRA